MYKTTVLSNQRSMYHNSWKCFSLHRETYNVCIGVLIVPFLELYASKTTELACTKAIGFVYWECIYSEAATICQFVLKNYVVQILPSSFLYNHFNSKQVSITSMYFGRCLERIIWIEWVLRTDFSFQVSSNFSMEVMPA